MWNLPKTFLFLFASCLPCYVFAYVPASATNSTVDAIAGGLNVTDVSFLHLQWYASGSYSQTVSYQLSGNGSQGVSQGALVHFSEYIANNASNATITPWIALVSCDFNATDASQEIDIFTLARDKGAVAALLYSQYSVACIINPEYADPANFDQVFDIFSTQSLTSSQLINYQFGQIETTNGTIYSAFNSSRLNASQPIVAESIERGYAVAPGYLFATLVAYNATNASAYQTGNNNPSAGGGGGSDGHSNTALAMIVLYAITGCVSALFCVVIISGAIRAIRHPERYGPRARYYGNPGDNQGMLQSRAKGLTRAILDTFPVVKFGNGNHNTGTVGKDIESDVDSRSKPTAIEMEQTALAKNGDDNDNEKYSKLPGTGRGNQPNVIALADSANSANDSSNSSGSQRDTPVSESPEDDNIPSQALSRNLVRLSRDREDEVVPDAIGRETCPICIVDFEEDDDIRILPCEGQHRFHQQCVDPWLLELSSSCPLCRHDFLALENMLNGESEDGSEFSESELPPTGSSNNNSRNGRGRFSRYVRSAIQRHRQRHRRQGDYEIEEVPVVPPVPQLPPQLPPIPHLS